MATGFVRRAFLGLALLLGAQAGQAFKLVDDDLYASGGLHVLYRYTSSGDYVERFTLPSDYGDAVRGVASGPDGLLYVVTATGNSFHVVVLDTPGVVKAVYVGPTGTYPYITVGKIVFAPNGDFYLAYGDGVARFSVGTSYGSVIYARQSGAFDLTTLPSGNLLVVSDSSVDEISPDGIYVRDRTPGVNFNFGRGIAYDSDTDRMFVTGYMNGAYQLMSTDGSSGDLIHSIAVGVGYCDLLLTAENVLVFGRYNGLPAIFDEDLNLIRFFGDDDGYVKAFVTQMEKPPAGPPPCFPEDECTAVSEKLPRTATQLGR